MLGREVVRACLGLGFAAAGIARAEPSSRAGELREWLAAGKHGTMEWLGEYLDERVDVTRLLPGARSVIVVADAYSQPAEEMADAPLPPGSGRIARYARGEDYHTVLRRRLKRLADTLRGSPMGKDAGFRAFVDSGPAMEREHAERAGLGWIGKHTLLIHPQRGSWLLLGGIATTLDLAPEPDASGVADHCGSCSRCIDACPTGAITPYSIDARRCVSYLTLEHDGPIDPALHEGIGENILGCDVCQEVCPFNHAEHDARVKLTVNEAYAPARGPGPSLPLLEILNWSESDRSRVLTLSAAKRASLTMLRRNALVAAGNMFAGRCEPGGLAQLKERIGEIASDPAEDEVVRATAQQVLSRLGWYSGGMG